MESPGLPASAVSGHAGRACGLRDATSSAGGSSDTDGQHQQRVTANGLERHEPNVVPSDELAVGAESALDPAAAELSTNLVADVAAELSSELVTKLAAELRSEPAANAAAELRSELAADAVAKLSPELVTKLATKLAAELTSELAADAAAKLSPKLATKPVAEPTTHPAVHLVA